MAISFTSSAPPRIAKVLVLCMLWGLFFFWTAEWLLFPTDAGKEYKTWAIKRTKSDFLDLNAPYYLMWTLPVFLFAFFALLFLELERRFPDRLRDKRTKELPKGRRIFARIHDQLLTQPIIAKSPLGILTAIDILSIAFFSFLFFWIFIKELVPACQEVDKSTMRPGIERWMIKVGRVGTWTGRAWYLPMALLFFPISRGSPILRLLNLPFEHAVRYHRWLGHFSLVVLLLHSITFSLHIYYTGGRSVYGIFQWKRFGVSNLAGVISIAAGIILWITSLEPVRKGFFDIFFVAHHLYLLFFVFAVWHIGEFASFYFLGCVMLFFIDRFLRVIQSRESVGILTARVLPSGVVELKFPKSPNLKYSALGFIYINVPSISRFEWHPFSTTSSSLQSSNDMSICIKPLGGWTKKLLNSLQSADTTRTKSGGCLLPIKLFAEGPYGPESDYFVRYKTLVLVAGGVGITPYLAILRDLLSRYQIQQEGLPTNVEIVWCVKRRVDLALLNDISASHIPTDLKVVVRAFVTQESTSDRSREKVTGVGTAPGYEEDEILFTAPGGQTRHEVTHIGQSNLWVAAVIAAATTGFILFHGVFHLYVVRPNHHTTAPFFFEHGGHGHSAAPQGKPFPTVVTCTLLFLSMFMGVIVFGGAVVTAWIWSSRSLEETNTDAVIGLPDLISSKTTLDVERNEACLLDQANITEGPRPHISEIFSDYAQKYEGEDLGVMVSGPASLQESVAIACRFQNFIHGQAQFQFHSISFDL